MVSKIIHLGINKTYRLFRLPDFPCVRIDHQYLVAEEDLYAFLKKYRGSCITVG